MANQQKYKKLLKSVRAFIDEDYRDQLQQRQQIKAVLKKLKKRERALKASLARILDESARTKQLNEIRMIRAQRKKALGIVKQMK